MSEQNATFTRNFFWKFTFNVISAKDNKQHWTACTFRLKANLCGYCELRANDPASWTSAFLFIVERSFCLFLYPSPSLLRMRIGLRKLQIAQQLIRWYPVKKYRKCQMFSKNTNVSGLWPFFGVRKNRCTVPRNIIDIIKMIEARARVIAHAGCI